MKGTRNVRKLTQRIQREIALSKFKLTNTLKQKEKIIKERKKIFLHPPTRHSRGQYSPRHSQFPKDRTYLSLDEREDLKIQKLQKTEDTPSCTYSLLIYHFFSPMARNLKIVLLSTFLPYFPSHRFCYRPQEIICKSALNLQLYHIIKNVRQIIKTKNGHQQTLTEVQAG